MGLVLISHSSTLVNGLREMVMQVAGEDVAVATQGGPRTGGWARVHRVIAEALRSALDAARKACSCCSTWAAPRSVSNWQSKTSIRRSGSHTRQRSPAGRRRGPRRGTGQRRSVAGQVEAAAAAASTMSKLPRDQ